MGLLTFRFFRKLLWSSAVAIIGFSSCAMAQVPMVKTASPGYYRMMHEQFEVTALFDGVFQNDISLLTNATVPQLQQLLALQYIDGTKMQAAVNAYLINTGKNLVLVDVGCGSLFGPKMGRILENIIASGYMPEQIDTILLTHMHSDHIAGLLDKDGKMSFPNARVYANQMESDYWLSEKNMQEAPEASRRKFKVAQEAVAPYQAAKKWFTFNHKDEIVPGIRAVLSSGHTPGHTLFRVTSDGRHFFILGDLVHSYEIQFARPDVAIEYDVDQKQAVTTRYKVFNLAAKYKWLVAGMHLPYPGIGHIRSNGDGSYTWLPAQYTPLP